MLTEWDAVERANLSDTAFVYSGECVQPMNAWHSLFGSMSLQTAERYDKCRLTKLFCYCQTEIVNVAQAESTPLAKSTQVIPGISHTWFAHRF